MAVRPGRTITSLRRNADLCQWDTVIHLVYRSHSTLANLLLFILTRRTYVHDTFVHNTSIKVRRSPQDNRHVTISCSSMSMWGDKKRNTISFCLCSTSFKVWVKRCAHDLCGRCSSSFRGFLCAPACASFATRVLPVLQTTALTLEITTHLVDLHLHHP